MFTGLIKEIGHVSRIVKKGKTISLTIKASRELLRDYKIGDSMAVNGVCLTCVVKQANQFTVDIMPETFKRTSFSTLRPSSKVNLEPAMLATSRFEGHVVTGHSDGLAQLVYKGNDENALKLSFAYPSNLRGQIISQGSIAIDGVSLTVVEASLEQFTVSLIPHTASKTTLADLSIGQRVNLETDILAKYIQAQFQLERSQ